MTNKLLPLAAAVSMIALSTPVSANEGMWTFDDFPAARVKAELGVDITPQWLDHVMRNAVRLSSGCSASIVSSRGLVLTNNHCVSGCTQDLSSADHDYFTHGYTAATAEEERKCAGLQAEILTKIADVTGRVQAAGKGLSGAALVKARDAVTADIEQQGCPDTVRYRCQVVDLYHGGEYKLYTYRKYTDVRLVFSPGYDTAFFGGDPDNFNFPRYDLDSAFVRLYENGKPIATPDHLKWNDAAPTAGEPVFVAGNPGSTDRELTMSQLETQRALALPQTITELSELRGRLIRFSEESPENKRTAQELLFGLENSYKVYWGELKALDDPAFFARLQAERADMRQKVAGVKDKLPADFGDPWATLDAVQQQIAALMLPHSFVEHGPVASDLFDYARTLVRGAEEREKPSADRLPGFADPDLPQVEKDLFAKKPVYPAVEQLLLEFWLSKAREYLTADSPYTKLLLGKDSPEDLSAKLAQSKLGDPAVREQLWKGGMAAIRASSDPMIQYVLRIDPAARQLRTAWNDKVAGPTTDASEKIAKARFAVYGDSIYPDATFTLRLSYGRIEGWTYHGDTVPPFTYFKGLYERATGKQPFELDPRWVAAQSKLNPRTVFDISTSNDIVGGNSGSPLIDAKGDVIGAIFDGNILSLGGAYGYDPRVNRSVAVSAAAVNEALRKVYGATALANELDTGA